MKGLHARSRQAMNRGFHKVEQIAYSSFFMAGISHLLFTVQNTNDELIHRHVVNLKQKFPIKLGFIYREYTYVSKTGVFL